MIKKELTHTSKSYWRNNELYDSERHKSYKVKLFGIIPIWVNTENFNCEILDDINETIGFKAKEKK